MMVADLLRMSPCSIAGLPELECDTGQTHLVALDDDELDALLGSLLQTVDGALEVNLDVFDELVRAHVDGFHGMSFSQVGSEKMREMSVPCPHPRTAPRGAKTSRFSPRNDKLLTGWSVRLLR